MRNIREIRTLPISELTDEEIVKATMDRLKTKSIIIGYLDENRWIFLWRYKNGFFSYVKGLKEHLEKWFGCKMIKIEEGE